MTEINLATLIRGVCHSKALKKLRHPALAQMLKAAA